ncbi:MAG: dipicolinate synthase subunit B [Eubacteriales bacterium]|nr:dipicolinate synthase subunit B [Eubacteriales bacterium]
MQLKGFFIGFGLTGSFCTHASILPRIEEIVRNGAEVQPILSDTAYNFDTKFGTAKNLISSLENITGRKVWKSIVEVEPIGPKSLLDVMVVAPCTGNTLAKLAYGITDTPVTMACKAQLRNLKPLVISVSTNDGLGANAKNIAALYNTKNVFIVPFYQDNPKEKPNSLNSKPELILPAIEAALEGKQLQPLLCSV